MPQQRVTISAQQATGHLFDMDGTLIKSDPALEPAWKAWAEKIGVEVGSEPWRTVVHRGRGMKVTQYMEEYVKEFGSPEAKERLRSPEALRNEEMEWFETQIGPAEAGTDGTEAIPGAAEYFNGLVARDRAAGRKTMGIYTSTHAVVARGRLANAGFAVDGVPILDVNSVKKGKPDPEGYMMVAADLGIPIENCVVYEDAKSGVMAGRASGAYVVGLRSTGANEGVLREFSDVIVDGLHHATLDRNGGVRFSNVTLAVEAGRAAELLPTPHKGL